METLTNDKATLEVQLATQVRQQVPEKSGSGERANSKNVFSHQLSKDVRRLCCPAIGSRRSDWLVLWVCSGKLVLHFMLYALAQPPCPYRLCTAPAYSCSKS